MMKHIEKSKEINILKEKKPLIILFAVFIYVLMIINTKSVLAGKPVSFICVYVIVTILLLVVLISTIYSVIDNEIKIEKLFLLCAIPLGITYTLLIPPGIVPDEWTHMRNVLSLSSQLTGTEKNGKITMRECEVELYNQQVQSVNSEYYDYIYTNLISISNQNNYVNIENDSIGFDQIFCYFPSVIATILARLLSLSAITTFYLGRIFNFIFYTFICFFALNKIPFGKLLLFTIMLLPMTVHQMFSLSYDAVINASAFSCIAYGMYFVYLNDRIKFKDIIFYAFCGLLLLTNKSSTYALILGIPVLAKYFNPGNERIALKVKIMIIFVLVLIIFFINLNTIIDSTQVSDIESVSGGIVSWAGLPSYTVEDILLNPINTVGLVINTFIQNGKDYVETAIGSLLGWLDISISIPIVYCWLGLLFIASFAEKSNGEVFTYRHKLLLLGISLMTGILILLGMALIFTPSGYPIIEGVQGRYFIPIIFLLLIPLQNGKVYLNAITNRCLLLIIPGLSILTVFNLITKVMI